MNTRIFMALNLTGLEDLLGFHIILNPKFHRSIPDKTHKKPFVKNL